MELRRLLAALRTRNPLSLLRIMSDWQSMVRMHFLFAALESGLLDALERPASREELIEKLEVGRPEILDALLEVGLSLGEISRDGRGFRLEGRRSRSLMGDGGDPLRALIQANVTYYASVYRNAAARMRGAPSGDHLAEIGEVVARVARLTEPFVRSFMGKLVSRKGSIRVLDVGCGSGVFLRSAAEANPSATGIGLDVDEEVVAQARRNLKDWGIDHRFDVAVGDIRVPPAHLGGSFDLITLHNIVYYFPTEERCALFRSLRSMLSAGGAIAVVSSVRSGGTDLAADNLNMATSSILGCTPLPELDEITAQLEESGFERVEARRLVPRSAFFGILARGARPRETGREPAFS